MRRTLYKINIRVSEAVYDELSRRAIRSDLSVRSVAAAILTRECLHATVATPRSDLTASR